MTTHVQDAFADSVTNQAVVDIATATGHTLVAAIAQWVTADTPINIDSITDSTAGQNTWYYSVLPAQQNPPANGSYDASQTQWGFAAVACANSFRPSVICAGLAPLVSGGGGVVMTTGGFEGATFGAVQTPFTRTFGAAHAGVVETGRGVGVAVVLPKSEVSELNQPCV